MTSPLITTVIPTYKRPRFLKRAIRSALMQTFKNIRVCVYDNASEDETEAVVTEFARKDERVVYVKNEHNLGAVVNMQQGVAAVTTPFFSLLNDDDYLLREFYSLAIAGIEAHPEAGFACAKTLVADVENKKIYLKTTDWRPGFYESTCEQISKMHRSHFVQTGVLLRREMREAIGFFEASGDDGIYLTMASACAPFVVVDYVGAVLTVHEKSLSSTVGVRQGNVDCVKSQLVETLNTCIAMNIPKELKACVILCVLKSYITSLDTFQLKSIHKGERDIGIPSFVSRAGVLAVLYGSTPRSMHGMLSFVLSMLDGCGKRLAKRNSDRKFIRSNIMKSDLRIFEETADIAAVSSFFYNKPSHLLQASSAESVG